MSSVLAPVSIPYDSEHVPAVINGDKTCTIRLTSSRRKYIGLREGQPIQLHEAGEDPASPFARGRAGPLKHTVVGRALGVVDRLGLEHTTETAVDLRDNLDTLYPERTVTLETPCRVVGHPDLEIDPEVTL